MVVTVVSRSLPCKSVCTSPTRLKNLSVDAEVAGTVRYCLVIKLLLMLLSPHQRVCRWAPVGLACTLEAGFTLGQRHVEIHGCGTNTQEFVQIATMLDFSIRVIHFCCERTRACVQQTRHKIESLPVLTQICDPSILHVLPDVLCTDWTQACTDDTGNSLRTFTVPSQVYLIGESSERLLNHEFMNDRTRLFKSNPYCICQFPNLINYHPQTLVLSTVG
jgi:hypothetical protein